MKISRTAVAIALASLFALPAAAQSTADLIERNANQHQRIEDGLRSGDLTTREAARLEAEVARVERMQAGALRDGRLSPEEARRIDAAQDRVGRDIARERHDMERGNPNSPSAQRMADAVDRNVHQQRRIEQGVRRGELTNLEAARLERGQARSDRALARAGSDGWFDRHESRHIQHGDRHASRQIYRERHDDHARGQARRNWNGDTAYGGEYAEQRGRGMAGHQADGAAWRKRGGGGGHVAHAGSGSLRRGDRR